MMNKLNGLSLNQTLVLIEAIELHGKCGKYETSQDKEIRPYLLSQLQQIKEFHLTELEKDSQ